MSLFGLLGKIDNSPEQQLRQKVMAKEPDSYLALLKLMDMQKMKQGSVPPQLQQQAQQPSVAQQVVGPQMQQPQGLPALPTRQAIPQQYAQGGLVGYQSGGKVFDPTQGTPLSEDGNASDLRRYADYIRSFTSGLTGQDYRGNPTPLYGAALNRQHPTWQGLTLPEGLGQRMAHELFPAAVDQYKPAGIAAPASGPMQQATYSNEGRVPNAISEMNRTYQQTPSAQPPGSRGAGVASLVARRPGEGYPEWKDPREGAPAYKTEEERNAIIRAKYEELKQQYGPDVAEQYLKEIQAERATMGDKYEALKNESLLRTGLGIMSGRSKHGLVNIGEGSMKGLDAYQAGRDKLDVTGRELRRQEMEAALAKQARDRGIQDTARTEGNQATERADRARTDAIASNKEQYEARVGKANYGLKEQQLDIEMAKVKVDMERNGILRDSSKMDAVARISQQAQQEALKIIEEDASKNPLSPWAKMSPQERFSASQVMAKRWIDNNVGVQAITGRAGAMPPRVQW